MSYIEPEESPEPYPRVPTPAEVDHERFMVEMERFEDARLEAKHNA